MHAEVDFQHVVRIQTILSIKPTHIIEPHLDMGIKWNGALVIPSPIAPLLEGLTVKEVFSIFSLAEVYYAFC